MRFSAGMHICAFSDVPDDTQVWQHALILIAVYTHAMLLFIVSQITSLTFDSFTHTQVNF